MELLLAFVITAILLAIGGWIGMSRKSQALGSLTLGWKLLCLSGLMFVPGGIIWILQWRPSSGPYMVGEKYPFGGYVEAWQVSMGFAFVAFGVLFAGASILASQVKNKWSWTTLLMSWVLLMFPHALIGITFILDDPSLAILGVSASVLPFALVWVSIVVLGFVLSGREILH